MPGAEFKHELVAGSRDVGNDHVDNAVFPAYIAQAREQFLRETVPRFEDYGRPVARLELDYHAELFAGDRIVGEIEVLDIGTTSLTTEVTLWRGDEKAATGKTIQVIVDPDAGEPTPVPEDWRAALTKQVPPSA
ncbi:MAG: acyl-CoA thioester hydrolase [Natronomonas sp.]